MDWITGIQEAINYMEDHITEELDYGEIARRSFSSPYHFQRVFSLLCGCTLGGIHPAPAADSGRGGPGPGNGKGY